MNYQTKYVVTFLYGTDVRTQTTVYAHNDVSALAMALSRLPDGDWVNHPSDDNFSIEITRK